MIRLRRSRHPHDKTLLSCYLASRDGEFIDPPVAEHLADCPQCRARFAELTGFMDGLHRDADAAVDALFPTERLDAQRTQILRRIDHIGQHARVITFPGRAADTAAAASPARQTTRWVAAAAVAGLVVGLTVGAFTSLTSVEPVEVAVSQPAAGEPVILRLPMDEETFLRELELARVRQRTRALMPLDAFTPSIREISSEVR